MNANQLINMVIRQVMRRLVNGGINAGVDAFSKRGKQANDAKTKGNQGPWTGQDTPKASPQFDAKQANKSMRVTRRMTKF